MPIYTIEKVCEPGAVKLGRKINCFTDREALELAQKIANAGLSLQVWRGDQLLASAIKISPLATHR